MLRYGNFHPRIKSIVLKLWPTDEKDSRSTASFVKPQVGSATVRVDKFFQTKFAAGDRKRWVDQLKRTSRDEPMPDPDDVDNPMREPSESGGSPDTDFADITISSFGGRKSSQRPPPSGMEGYLMKKSPALLSGWQKRYFVIQDPGEMNYYLTVS